MIYVKCDFDIKDSMKKENFKIKEELEDTKGKFDDVLTEHLKEMEEKFPSSEFKTIVKSQKIEFNPDGLGCKATTVVEIIKK